MTSLETGQKKRELERLNRDFLQNLALLVQQVPHLDLSEALQSYQTGLKNLSDERKVQLREGDAITLNTNNIHEDDDSGEANKLEKLLNNVLSGITTPEDKTNDRQNLTETQSTAKQHISWHQYFMSVAQLAAKRSKDPATQVGACIVNQQNKIVATGYNGMPNGVRDDLVPWTKEGPYLETKYAYVVHAELNAILNCVSTDQTGCRVYVSLFPCNECAKAIIQSGIRLVIYLSDKHRDKDGTKAAKRMFQMAGVIYKQYSSLAT